MAEKRTQQQRSEHTRELLMQATMDCLIEVGYDRTTTRAVEARAGVTRGALTHHYASKSDLLISSVQHIARLRTERMSSAAARLGPERELAKLIALMWQQYLSPLFYASMELWNASRTDPVLRKSLYEHEKALGMHLQTTIAAMFDVPAQDEAFSKAVDLTLRYMRGAAMTMILRHDQAAEQRLLSEWTALVAPLFETARELAKGNRVRAS